MDRSNLVEIKKGQTGTGLLIEHDGVINPIEIKKTSNPSSALTKVFSVLDKSSTPRSTGAVICMKPKLDAIDRQNYVVPIWCI